MGVDDDVVEMYGHLGTIPQSAWATATARVPLDRQHSALEHDGQIYRWQEPLIIAPPTVTECPNARP